MQPPPHDRAVVRREAALVIARPAPMNSIIAAAIGRIFCGEAIPIAAIRAAQSSPSKSAFASFRSSVSNPR